MVCSHIKCYYVTIIYEKHKYKFGHKDKKNILIKTIIIYFFYKSSIFLPLIYKIAPKNDNGWKIVSVPYNITRGIISKATSFLVRN